MATEEVEAAVCMEEEVERAGEGGAAAWDLGEAGGGVKAEDFKDKGGGAAELCTVGVWCRFERCNWSWLVRRERTWL